MQYSAPTTADLMRLKAELHATGARMAELAGLAGDQQWRKYTGGHSPREMSLQMLFFIAAQLELEDAAIARVLERMRAIGADVDLQATVEAGPTT